jgi:hypothetical protein
VGRVVKLYSSDAVIYDIQQQIVSLSGNVIEEPSERLKKHSRENSTYIPKIHLILRWCRY